MYDLFGLDLMAWAKRVRDELDAAMGAAAVAGDLQEFEKAKAAYEAHCREYRLQAYATYDID